jgi:UDP-galactopyranose mutase
VKPILVVGAGFAGAVHAWELAEAGYQVRVIDQRAHIGGNAYDYRDENGIRVHAYGPHLFHTKNLKVIDWVAKFSEFVPYLHKVRALLPGGEKVPLPINLDTVNAVFGTVYETAEEVQAHLRTVSLPIAAPANAAEYLYANIGRELTDLFFRPYTKKMWALDLGIWRLRWSSAYRCAPTGRIRIFPMTMCRCCRAMGTRRFLKIFSRIRISGFRLEPSLRKPC